MAKNAVAVEALGTVRLLRFGHPPSGIISAADVKELIAVLEEQLADGDVRAVVLAGRDPGIFIRHYDLRSIVKAAEALHAGAIDEGAFADGDFARLTELLAGAEIPVIAAINGICMGGGLEIALACDLRIAQRDVEHIGLPEIRANIIPGGGGTVRLARLIGLSAALDIALRGRTFGAARAYALGIVGELADDAVEAALRLAASLAARDPAAVAAIKRVARIAQEMPLADALAAERVAFGRVLRGDRPLSSLNAMLAAGTMLEDVRPI